MPFPPSKLPKPVLIGSAGLFIDELSDGLDMDVFPVFLANGLKTFFLSFLAPNFGLVPKSKPPLPGDNDELFETTLSVVDGFD